MSTPRPIPGRRQTNYLIGMRWLSTNEVRAEIVRVLPDLPPGDSVYRLTRHFGSAELSSNTVNKMLLALVRDGKAVKIKRGSYAVKPKTPKA